MAKRPPPVKRKVGRRTKGWSNPRAWSEPENKPMGDAVTILKLHDRDRWREVHADGGLPSQSWEYAWGLSASGAEPQLAVVEAAGARMLLPFVEHSWQGSTDIATILGMSGASIAPGSPAPLALWRNFAATRGWVSGYIQLAVAVEIDAGSFDDPVAVNNTTFLLPLQRGDILPLVSRTIRRKIIAAREEAPTLIDDPQVLGPHLKRLYSVTMQRVGAPPHYQFSAETLGRWLDDPATLALGAQVGDEVESVYVFRFAGTYAEAHITGSTVQGRRLVPWLIREGIERLRHHGVTCLDLGGSPRAGDGLYQYKAKFRGIPKPICAVHQVYDRAKYEEMCRVAGVISPTRWFPPYRARGVIETSSHCSAVER